MFWRGGSQRAVLAYSSRGMQVRVLFFGVLKELFGGVEEMVEMAEGSRVAELLASFERRAGERGDLIRSIAVAVNREYAQADCVLRDGDEVALLPPVSGGAR